MTYLYGIKNCDTIKKARKWLETNDIDYVFHDYRTDGLEQNWLAEVENTLGWENLVNKRGTTYRQLSDEVKAQLNRESAIELMLENPAIIKRPLLKSSQGLTLGFNVKEYEAIFSA